MAPFCTKFMQPIRIWFRSCHNQGSDQVINVSVEAKNIA